MAPRLTVIISQAAVRHGRVTDAEEALLTELMLASGLDATLIGSLDGVQIDSTDYLCLSGMTQSLALVSSLSLEEVATHWRRLQLGGEVVQAGRPATGPGRRIVHFPLECGTQAIVAQLRQLLIDKSIQTVGLTLPSSTAAPPVDRQVVAAEKANAAAANRTSEPYIAAVGKRPAIDAIVPEEDWPDLDQLVDDFDALDL